MGLLSTVTARIIDRSLARTNLYQWIFPYCATLQHSVNYISLSLPEKLNESTLREIDDYLLGNRVWLFGRQWSVTEYEASYGQTFNDQKWWRIDWNKLVVDPKFIWEINRHQFLPLLALASKYNDYRRLAINKIRADLTDWFERNPPEYGINWASNLEVALRAISWCLTYWILTPKPDQFWLQFLNLLQHHGNHLEKFIPYTKACMPNNHLLGETAALVLLGIFFKCRRWLGYQSLLERLAREQFYNDGVNFEQSFNYHNFSLKLLLLVGILLKDKGSPFGWETDQRIRNAAIFLKWAQKPDGSYPNIGDNDNGMAFRIGATTNDFIDTLEQIGIYYQVPFLLENITTVSDTTKILIPGWSKFPAISNNLDRVHKFNPFPDGGFYVWRSEWGKTGSYLLIKAGPHKNHAHADLLHFEYSYHGENILVDAGTFQYNKVNELRKYFRSTPAHNTIAINRRDQSKQFKTFRWLNCANVSNIFYSPAEVKPSIVFKGTVQYPGGKFKHHRTLVTCNELNYLGVYDWVEGGAEASLYFHIDPHNIIKIVDDTENCLELITPLGRKFRILFRSAVLFEIRLEKVPFSIKYGEIKSHTCICIRLAGEKEKMSLNTYLEHIK